MYEILKPKDLLSRKSLISLWKVKYNILMHVKATLFMLISIKMLVLKQLFYSWSQSTLCQQHTEYSATSFVSILNCISSLLIRLHALMHLSIPRLLTVVLPSAQESHESGKPQECQDTVTRRDWCSLYDWHEAYHEGLSVSEGKTLEKEKFLRIIIRF